MSGLRPQRQLPDIRQTTSSCFLQFVIGRSDGLQQKRHDAALVHRYAIERIEGQMEKGKCRRSVHVRIVVAHELDQRRYGAQPKSNHLHIVPPLGGTITVRIVCSWNPIRCSTRWPSPDVPSRTHHQCPLGSPTSVPLRGRL